MKTQQHAAVPCRGGLAAGVSLAACGASNEPRPPAAPRQQRRHRTQRHLTGAGSSAQQAAMQAWKAGFNGANPDVTVNYDPVGSGGGREQFLAGGVDFAGSDAALKDDELAKAQEPLRRRDVVELPVYISPIAVVYNLQGVDDLQLSPGDRRQDLQRHDHHLERPGDRRRQPGREAARAPRSPRCTARDESGTTQNFTDYLSKAAARRLDRRGRRRRGRSRAARPRRAPPVSSAPSGRQGHDRLRRREPGRRARHREDQGRRRVRRPDRPRPPPRSSPSSKRVDGRGDSTTSRSTSTRDTTDGGRATRSCWSSYHIGCTKYDDAAKATLVKAFETYVISEEGQQAAAEGRRLRAASRDALRTQISPGASTRITRRGLSTPTAGRPGGLGIVAARTGRTTTSMHGHDP